jgi:Flp pilus assembly protein TadG
MQTDRRDEACRQGWMVRLWRLWRQRRGNAALEMALIGPLLVVLMIGAADYGAAVYQKMQVQHAAQAGAEYALRNGFVSTSIVSAVTAATNLAGVSATPAPAQSCGCASGTTITAATCGASCPAGGTAGVYVTVSAQGTYTTILPYPGIPSSFTFNAASTVRIQ